jgi:glycosyltransferase involved in cell wall biosynthesis
MRRITIDMRMLGASGIGTYLRNLIPLVTSMGSDITYYLLGDTEGLDRMEGLNGEHIHCIDCRTSIYSVSEQLSLVRKIPRCDVYFSPHYNVPLLYRGKLVTTIHDIFHLADENNRKTRMRTVYARGMLSAALRKSKIVMTDSQFTLNEMRKYKLPGLDKVRVIHLGFGLENTGCHSSRKPPGNGYLLYVGNVKPHKNLRRLVDAYKLLHDENRINVPLKIVGEAERFITGMPELKEEIASSPWGRWIEFTGWIDDGMLKDCYRQATALVQPSLYEGFGLPPLEAMACGCPCVVSNAASLPEVCGDAALYCNPYDVNDIADKIYKVINDANLRLQLIERGYERVKLFSWEKTARAFLNVIDEVSQL